MDFNTLKKNLKSDYTGFKSINVAILATSATQYLTTAIRGYGYERKLNIQPWEADYDTIDITINDADSPLYTRENDYVILFYNTRKLQSKFYSSNHKEGFASDFLQQLVDVIDAISEKIKTNIIIYNLEEELDAIFGNFGNKTSYSFIYQVRKINYQLMLLAQGKKNVYIADVSALQAARGKAYSYDTRLYVNADMAWSVDFTTDVAVNTVQILDSFAGLSKKCLVLDLDNTTWGGIIGDDGIENIQIGELGTGKSFTQLQKWAKGLKDRGIILAICSKNTEEIAQEPFIKHPDMVLRLEDISIFVANWDNKADNIRYIQSILNIGFDSMVFLDDNPFEREMVRTNIPGLTVPELPEDPADYVSYLNSLNLFETVSYTSQDKERTKQYQEEANRTIARTKFTDEKAFLKNLNMTSVVKPFDSFNVPRVAQLTQRSNQFNLRTARYSEEDIKRISSSGKFVTLTFNLADKFGEYGLIAVVILEQRENSEMFIDTWIMSCRVLKRGMENLTLNQVVKVAKEIGAAKLIGEYLPTAKNGIVKDHYKHLGFSEEGNRWVLITNSYQPVETFIEIKN